MKNNRLQVAVTAGAIIIGCLIVVLWLLLPSPLSMRAQRFAAPDEVFLLKVETETDSVRILLALRNHMGFIEARESAGRVRDLCLDVDKERWEKWSRITDDMDSWYRRLVIQESASLDKVLNELYAKYPFLRLEGVKEHGKLGDMLIRTPEAGSKWNTSETAWQDIAGLLISKNLETSTDALVIFEGDMVTACPQAGGFSGFVRLLINGEELDAGEVRVAADSDCVSEAESVMLKWRGQLPAGELNVKVQAKVSHRGVSLRSGEKDMPKLILIR